MDDYDSIRKQAEERVKKRDEAKDNLIGFVVVCGFLWVLWIAARVTGFAGEATTPTFFVLLIITFLWGLSAIGDWHDKVYAVHEREERFRKEVEEEIERELARRALTEKRKRLGLTDDGELVEIIEEDEIEPASREHEFRQ